MAALAWKTLHVCVILYTTGTLLVTFVALLFLLRIYCKRARVLRGDRRRYVSDDNIRVAFLHPECLNGGGGERVLWLAVQALKAKYPGAEIAICAPWGSRQSPTDVVAKARMQIMKQFHVQIPGFIPINTVLVGLTNPVHYPRLTLLFQAFGGVVLGLEAYLKCKADVFVDTSNQPFALMPAKLLGATTVSYIHYPTISLDMLAVVRNRTTQFNNASAIALSPSLTRLKLYYYRAFARLYAFAGLFSDITMANSSWTGRHLQQLWHKRIRAVPAGDDKALQVRQMQGTMMVLHPPCDTLLLDTLSTSKYRRTRGLLLSVAQYRPEKKHMQQLQIVQKLIRSERLAADVKVKLIMVGGARNQSDKDRVIALREARSRLNLNGIVDIRVNVSWDDLLDLYSRAWAGLHTMHDEHFGISVVAQQAAGVVPICHRSGGIATDIIEDGVSGYLADDDDEYVDKLLKVLVHDTDHEIDKMRFAARQSASKFSDSAFGEKFIAVMNPALRGTRQQ